MIAAADEIDLESLIDFKTHTNALSYMRCEKNEFVLKICIYNNTPEVEQQQKSYVTRCCCCLYSAYKK